jgi:hypothetical protein
MDTKNHQVMGGEAKATSTRAGTVSRIDALKRRKHLAQLLMTRSHLATMAAQQRSHGLDDATESFTLQAIVETCIHELFPSVYEELFPVWVEADIAAEHPRAVLDPDCGICRSVATAHGVNLIPPVAA